MQKHQNRSCKNPSDHIVRLSDLESEQYGYVKINQGNKILKKNKNMEKQAKK